MGQLCQGGDRALYHNERYGLRTANGKTGGSIEEATITTWKSAAESIARACRFMLDLCIRERGEQNTKVGG